MPPLEKVLEKFGIHGAPAQEALIENLYLAEYFEPEKIWDDVHYLSDSYGDDNEIAPTGLYHQIKDITENAFHDIRGKKVFNPEYVLRNMFIGLPEQDIEDWLVYVTQNAFGRKPGQELYHITPEEWMETHGDDFMRNAKDMGFVDEITLDRKHVDEYWIAGAGRLRCTTRLEGYRSFIEDWNFASAFRLLTGNRPVGRLEWSNDLLDGETRPENAKRFILFLADQLDVKLDEGNPFTTKNEKTGDFIVNYAEGEKRRLTEADMFKEVYSSTFGIYAEDRDVAYVAAENNRPTFADIVHKAADMALKSFENTEAYPEEFHIAVQAEQPHVRRFAVEAEAILRREYAELFNEVSLHVHPVGQACEVGPAVVHSAMSVYMAAKYNQITQGQERKRGSEQLMFRDRQDHQKDKIIPPFPGGDNTLQNTPEPRNF